MDGTEAVFESIRSGDESLIGRWYDQYRSAFLSWSKKSFPLDREQLIDIYQDAVIILYQNIAEGKITELSSSIKTYLFGIAKHLIYKELRRRNRNPTRLDEIPEIQVEAPFLAQVERQHEREQLREALQKLGSPCKQMIEYFYYYEFSLEAIAKRMRYKNADTVKAQKHRCLKKLEQLFKERTESYG